MIVLDKVANIILFAWSLFTFCIISKILQLVWPVLKEDWFWFATKSSYYKGFAFGIAWVIVSMAPSRWIGISCMLFPFIIQIGIASIYIRNKHLTSIEKYVLFGIPFFMFPLWLAVRQGQQQGEIPTQPNPALNSDPTATI